MSEDYEWNFDAHEISEIISLVRPQDRKTARLLFIIPDLLMPEPQPVVCKLDMIELYYPQVDFSQGSVRESLQVNGSGAAEFITGGLADGAGELGATDTADTFRLEGDGASNLRVGPEFRAMPGDRVGGDDKGVVLLIPGIEARCAPWSLFADGGDCQQVVPAEKRPDSFIKFYSFHL